MLLANFIIQRTINSCLKLILNFVERDTSNSSEESDECESSRETRHNYITDCEMSTVTDYRGHPLSRSKTFVPFQHYGSFYLRMGAVGKLKPQIMRWGTLTDLL